MGVSTSSAPSPRKNPTAKFTPTIPSESRIASSCLSVRLREVGQRACALEWVATRGASVIPATSQKPGSFRCERSTKTPKIGRASCRERGVDLGGRRIIKKKTKKSVIDDIYD